MRELHLLRHAKSSWDDPSLEDHERPLAPRGKTAARRIGEELKQVQVDLVLCSSALRARETLKALASAVRQAQVEIEDEIYQAGDEGLLGRIRRIPDEVRAVLLIGHNPAMQTLAGSLAGSGSHLEELRVKYPTAALATITFPFESWAEITPGTGKLVRFAAPSKAG